MNHVKNLCCLVLLLLCSYQSFSQNLSNKGKEFWVGYGHHQFHENGGNSQEMVLYLSADQAATVTVSINGTTYSQTYNVPANSVIATAPIPKAGTFDARLYNATNLSEGLYDRGIRIQSNVPIVAYSHIYGSASSGATMLMPVDTWGYSYTSLNSKQNYGSDCFSWTYVVAKENNTRVEITPSVVTRGGKPAGVPFQVTLNKGQIYQVLGAIQSGANGWEMTNTRVKSIANSSGECYPIAVFSGSSRTSNPLNCGSGGGDNDMQQLFPKQAWGKRYLIAPTSVSTSASTYMVNGYKIITSEPGTNVYRNGVLLPPPAIAGDPYVIETSSTMYITADKPIMVAQFMSGGSTCIGGGVGDPEMIYLSPIEQGIKRVGFYRNTLQSITVNYLTMIIPTAGLASLTIDGVNGAGAYSHSYTHPGLAGYTVVIKRWTAAQAQCIVQSDSAFTAITYGLGSVESYGYNAGTMINNLNVIGAIRNTMDTSVNVTQHPFTCGKTPFQLSVMVAYQPTQMVWQLSQVPNLSPNTDVTVTNPTPASTTVINGTTYYQYTLPGTFSFSDTGTYTIPIKNFHPTLDNCNNSEVVSFTIQAKMQPKTDFTYTHTGCLSDSVLFASPVNTGNGYTATSWKWSFADATTATGSTTTKLFTTAGAQSINLKIVTQEGCLGDTTRLINIFTKPQVTIGATPTALCVGGSVTFTDTSSYQGSSPINGWYWNFDNGTVTNPSNSNPQTINFPNHGTYTVKHVVKVSPTCISDTATKVINVYAKPNLGFTYPTGCLPANGVVTFNNTTSTPDGQAMTYSWTFGDPGADPNTNPNTSTQTSPSHTYTNYGTYPVTLSAVTANGCTKDTAINAVLNVRPTLAYSALSPICENTPGTLSVANGSVTNGVVGTSYYSGPGTTAAGQFSPSAAGPGTHTIWYVFTANAGCKDSIQQTIQVYARPKPSFTFPTGCLPITGLVQFNNTTTIADAQTMTYNWTFGDNNATPSNPNTSTAQNPSHIYTNTGSYPVKLAVASAQGCLSDTTITTTFSVTPDLAYPALNPVCENTPSFSVGTATVTNNVTGTGVYSGPGTSATGTFNPAVAGPGTHTITYIFNSTGGCADTATQTIQVSAAPKPLFSFGTGCLPISGQVQFTNSTTIADAQTLTYNWNFGDNNATPSNPNTSTATNPTHNYTSTGNFPIKLTATSSNGCTKDTIITATFNITPDLAYAALSPVCENGGTVSVASATVTNNITGNGVYSGPGTAANGSFNPAVAGPGTHTITYIFTAAGGCADTATQTILVYARPRPAFTSTSGCLPVNGLVQFTNNTTIADAQTMTYNWNFDDASATPANPNTSTATNPTHNYSNSTNHNVKLTVTSSNGCVADTTISRVYSVTPDLAYPALTDICQNISNTSVASATVANGVTGTGVYSGNGTTAAGVFTPSVAGAGQHTISYIYTTASGCADTATQTITVLPKPTAIFSVDNNICLNATATVTDASTIPTGTITGWNWNFGNSTTANNTNNTPFTVGYTTAAPYTIKLVAISNNGCISDTTSRTVNVRPMPVVNFTLPAGICMPNGSATFTNSTTIADNSTLSYSWNFGDNTAPSTATSPTHTYATTMGPVDVTLSATSPFGCRKDTTKTLTAFYEKPVASFDVSPDTLCQGVTNTFTNTSFAPNSTVSSWSWSFGDGTTSQASDPTKKYAQPGNYGVSLTVKNAVGCTSDPYRDTVTVYLQPRIDAGPSFVVMQGTQITFRPVVNGTNGVTFTWTPSGDFTNPNALYPSIIATKNVTYTLTAVGLGNCTATDTMSVKILKPFTVPNAFSPNGDGVNDTWAIPNLIEYPGCTVEVYNRYGQMVYQSVGYGRAWDGTYQGNPLPFATYYYIITPKNGVAPVTGSVTIIK